MIWAGVAQALVTRVGPRWVTTVGMTVLALTMLGYTRLPVDGSYWPDLLPLYLIFALGLAFGFIPVTIAAFIGVPPQQAGPHSGFWASESFGWHGGWWLSVNWIDDDLLAAVVAVVVRSVTWLAAARARRLA